MSKVVEDLKYTEEHEWLKIEGDEVTIGITDFAQESLGDIVFVELPEEGTTYNKGDSFGVVESIKSVSDLYTPIDCEVIAKNSDTEDGPEKLNSSPFDSWLIRVKVKDKGQLETLMDSKKYTDFCDQN